MKKTFKRTMKINSEFYTYRVIWSEEDQEHVGLCAEFPSLSYLDRNMSKALTGINNLVIDVIKDLLENGEPVPEILSKKEYSGKFLMRIPPEKHRELAIKAAEEKVSLNRYASAKLLS
jgi:predicted HicB family RNase H-like nuclease